MSAESCRRLKVLWLIKGLGPGGAENLLLNHARGQRSPEIDYHVAYVLSDYGQLAAPLREEGLPVHSLASTSGPWPRALRQLLAAGNFDVIHIHSPSTAAVARVVVRSLRPARRPAVMYTEHAPWHAYHPMTRLANHATFGLNDATVAVSHEVHESMAAKPRSRTAVLRHGINLADIRGQLSERSAVRSELGFRDNDIVVGTVANLRPSKGYFDLLRAAQVVCRASENVYFVAAGLGPLEEQLTAAQRALDLSERFKFLGHRADPVRLMSAFDVFVLASHAEGLPVALMEALAVGLPVVATRVGGIPEAVNDGVEAVLVESHKPDQLADALLRLSTDSAARDRMRDAARLSAEKFDVNASIKRIEATYRRIAGSNVT